VHVDNVVDLTLCCGTHSAAAGHAFLVRDPDRLTWGDFFGHYATMAGRRSAMPSIPSDGNVRSALGRRVRRPLAAADASLTRLIEPYEDRFRFAVRYGLKAPRRAIQLTRQLADAVFPEPWSGLELQRYSSPGHISIEKARRLLGYAPSVGVADGMRDTECWLRDQNILPARP
jgi:hypothetical protein